MNTVQIVSASGSLGTGVDEKSLTRAVDEHDIDFIAADGGSNDGGPGNYGGEKMGRDKGVLKEDLRKVLKIRDREEIPFLVGSCGVSGAAQHLKQVVELAEEVAKEEGLTFNLATIFSDVASDIMKSAISEDRIRNLSFDKQLEIDDVEDADTIVAQIGHEPYVTALDDGADVILAGRSLDTSQFAAIPISKGYDRGLSIHLAKLLECGGSAAVPYGHDCVVGTLTDDYFEVEPSSPEMRCTVKSVAAQTLHEKSNPHTIFTPHGQVDISDSTYEQMSERRVRVSGSTFEEQEPHTLLVEGVKHSGYRAISVASTIDPRAITNIQSIVEGASDELSQFNAVDPSRFKKQVRVYGGSETSIFKSDQAKFDDVTDQTGELVLLFDVVGDTQNIATDVCSTFMNTLRKYEFHGKLTSRMNIALPFSTPTGRIFPAGAMYEWSVYHLLEGVSSSEVTKLSVREIDGVATK